MVSNLKLMRISQEKSQVTLGLESRLPQWRISLLERGIKPKVEEMRDLAKALGVSASYIFPAEKYPHVLELYKNENVHIQS